MSWQIVPKHTRIRFTVRHMMIRKVRGRFRRFSMAINYDEQKPVNTTLKVKIDVLSIDTGDKQRDSYLRSDAFLNAAAYPQITFVSKQVQQINDRRGRLIGDLQIMDITREIILDIRRTGRAKNSAGSARFQASTTISRKTWGLEWNAALEAGGWLVGDEIKIDLELELTKAP